MGSYHGGLGISIILWSARVIVFDLMFGIVEIVFVLSRICLGDSFGNTLGRNSLFSRTIVLVRTPPSQDMYIYIYIYMHCSIH